MQAPQVHLSRCCCLDLSMMNGCELGQALWITEPVCSQEAQQQSLMHDHCFTRQNSTIHVGLHDVCVWSSVVDGEGF